MRYDEIQWEDEEESTGKDKEKAEQPGSKEESFADLMASAEGGFERKSIRVGGKVEGIISAINDDSTNVLVEIDPLHTGVIDKQDLMDEDGSIKYHAGDQISAYVVSRKGGEVLLSTTMSQSSQSIDDLHMAQQNQLPVNGKVSGENKGGFEVTIMGKTAFCPISQIDTRFVENKAEYMGNEYRFVIEKVEENGRNIVVSRAKLLRLEAEEKIADLEKRMSEELILDGSVSELKDYGAFVDLGGLDGFLHVSEMSYSRVNKAGDYLTKGDKVRVKVLKIETVDGKRRISLSMKAVQDDPWSTIAEDYKEGESYSGRVTKLESFGAFVELGAGVEGLIHISEMSWEKRIHHPSDILSVGDKVNVRLAKIDLNSKRLSLSLKHVEDDPWVKTKDLIVVGATLAAKVISLKGFGAIVELSEGITGLIPMGTLKSAFGESYRKEASPPKEISVVVKHIDEDEKKILLTLPNVEEDDEEDKSYQEYLEKQKQKSQSKTSDKAAQGTFGALLAAKLNQGKK